MARLPTVGGDTSSWGAVLNTFLSVAHNSDGSLNAIVSVKDATFGAKGDGTTDDTTAIAAALTAAGNAGGGAVLFPPGTYITTTITLPNRVRLVGAGMHATVIKLKNGTNGHVIQNYVSPDGIIANAMSCGVLDLMIDGNKANQSGTSHGIYFTVNPLSTSATNDDDFDTHQLVQNVYIKNVLTDGYCSSGRAAISLRNIQTLACGRYGINPSYDHWITDCNVGQSGLYGYYLNNPEIHLSNCASFYSGQTTPSAGFYLGPGAVDINLDNCTAQDNTTYGYQFDTTKCINMAGCIADSNSTSSAGTYPAVDMWSTTACTIDGLTCVERKADGVHSWQTTALRMRSSCSGNRIAITHTATGGATISSPITSDSTSLAGNDIRVGAQNGLQTVAYAASITPEPYNGSIIQVGALTGAITIANPTGTHHPGCPITLILTQDATGGRVTSFGTAYKTSWTPSTTASKTNIITFVYDGTNWWQTNAATGM